MRELNVKPINFEELASKWGRDLANQAFHKNRAATLYIRCNKKGIINYDVAPVYHKIEIDQERKKRVVNILQTCYSNNKTICNCPGVCREK